MRKPIFTAKHRCLWIEQVTFDTTLAPLHHRVGCAIVVYVNRFSGETFVGRDTVAQRLAISTKSVDRAVAVLEKAGHLVVNHARGRGHSNRYRPVLQTPIITDRPNGDSSRNSNGTNEVRKGDILDLKTGHMSPPNHSTSTKAYNHESSEEAYPSSGTSTPSPSSAQTVAKIELRPEPLTIHDTLIRSFDGDGFDGEEVFLNLGTDLYAICCNRLAAGRLSNEDVRLARSHLLEVKQQGFALEPFPKPRRA